MVDALASIVTAESPSREPRAVWDCAEAINDLATSTVGVPADHVEVGDSLHLRWSFGRPRVLLLGHYDTVWPLGTVRRWPFSVKEDRATGPGVFDMKAGIVQLFTALAGLPDVDGVTILLTSDEEVGATTSRPLIEEASRNVSAVLVFEPAADGALKVARKGIGWYQFVIEGRAAHAGLEPEVGVNAAVEAAHVVLAAEALNDPALGTTVTTTTITAGTAVNTVPPGATVDLDVRAFTTSEMDRVDTALLALGPRDPRATVVGRALSIRPPLEPSATKELFALACEHAARLGLQKLRGAAVGGASDGNITAALGVRTLDGIGAVGGNAHAEGEWVHVPSMLERSRLAASVLTHLLQEAG
jgi:glutamate carboxypeptidase